MDAVNGLSFFCSSETVVKNPAPLIFKSSHLNKWKKKKVGGGQLTKDSSGRWLLKTGSNEN